MTSNEENKNIDMREESPSFVYRDGMIADKEYVLWLTEVKKTVPTVSDKSVCSCKHINVRILLEHW